MKEFISWLRFFLPSFLSLFFPSFLRISESANITNPSQAQQMKSLGSDSGYPAFLPLHLCTALSRSLFIFPSFALGSEAVTLPAHGNLKMYWLGCPCTGMLHFVCACVASKAPCLTILHTQKKGDTDSEKFVGLPKGTWSCTPELGFYPSIWHGAFSLCCFSTGEREISIFPGDDVAHMTLPRRAWVRRAGGVDCFAEWS